MRTSSLGCRDGGRRHRDRRAFERAYTEHRQRAFAAALRVLRDPAAAEEVVQDVCAQLWRRPGSFDGTRGSLRSYIAMLARSRAVDRWRSEAALGSAVGRLTARAGSEVNHERSAAERVIERERAARVVSLIDRLPASQREVVLLAYGKTLTAREISDAIGVPLGTAKSRMRLGPEKMRETAESVR